MLKLYKKNDNEILYWETWENKKGTHTIHWGTLGNEGDTSEIKRVLFKSADKRIKELIEGKKAEGYEEIAEDDHDILLIEYKVDGFGNEDDLEKRHELQEVMDEALGWAGLGHCDGGSIGSGTMEVCCLVVDFDIAKKLIEKALEDSEFDDYTRIYQENDFLTNLPEDEVRDTSSRMLSELRASNKPEHLLKKWDGKLELLLSKLNESWDLSNSDRPPMKDSRNDTMTPRSDKKKLLLHGKVVWGVVTRAFKPAYIPGKHTFYGSVAYSLDSLDCPFELAWKVNQLREYYPTIPKGAEKVAKSIQNDLSNFARMKLPKELDITGESYFANICIHRERLPLNYIHNRLLPVLVAPDKTKWCCILPLEYWDEEFKQIWTSGPPIYLPEEVTDILVEYDVKP